MMETFQKKSDEMKALFAPLTPEERYTRLIKLGRDLPAYPPELKTPDRIVPGCQSVLYLAAKLREGKLFFQAQADALISAGLAALLIAVYSGETPETILKCPPTFIADLGLTANLSLNRSNGLANIHLRMQQEALKILLKGDFK